MNKHNKYQHDWYSFECTKTWFEFWALSPLSAHRENRCLALPVLSMVLFTERLVADSGRISADVPMRAGMACAQSQREVSVLIKHSSAMQSRCGCKHLWVPGYNKPSGVPAYHWAQSGGPSAPNAKQAMALPGSHELSAECEAQKAEISASLWFLYWVNPK